MLQEKETSRDDKRVDLIITGPISAQNLKLIQAWVKMQWQEPDAVQCQNGKIVFPNLPEGITQKITKLLEHYHVQIGPGIKAEVVGNTGDARPALRNVFDLTAKTPDLP